MRDLSEEIINSLDNLKNLINKYILEKEKVRMDMDKLEIINQTKEIKLSYNQATLLKELLDAEDNFCTYEHLCNAIYGYYDNSALNSLKVCASRLREKTKGIIKIKAINKKGLFLVGVKK